jgi:hypothetical protein
MLIDQSPNQFGALICCNPASDSNENVFAR